jgi:hypothetical protein
VLDELMSGAPAIRVIGEGGQALGGVDFGAVSTAVGRYFRSRDTGVLAAATEATTR